MFEDFAGSFDVAPWSGWEGQEFHPRIDLSATDDAVLVTAEMPGLEEKDFELNLTEGLLTLKGEKRDEQEERREGYQRVETRRGAFQRAFRLPWEVDPETVKAAYKNGILTITVPKPAEVEPQGRSVPVTTS